MTAGTDRHNYLIPRLMGMMFLQYFTLGAWVVTLSKYLGSTGDLGGLDFTPSQAAGIYSTFAIGGLVAALQPEAPQLWATGNESFRFQRGDQPAVHTTSSVRRYSQRP